MGLGNLVGKSSLRLPVHLFYYFVSFICEGRSPSKSGLMFRPEHVRCAPTTLEESGSSPSRLSPWFRPVLLPSRTKGARVRVRSPDKVTFSGLVSPGKDFLVSFHPCPDFLALSPAWRLNGTHQRVRPWCGYLVLIPYAPRPTTTNNNLRIKRWGPQTTILLSKYLTVSATISRRFSSKL